MRSRSRPVEGRIEVRGHARCGNTSGTRTSGRRPSTRLEALISHGPGQGAPRRSDCQRRRGSTGVESNCPPVRSAREAPPPSLALLQRLGRPGPVLPLLLAQDPVAVRAAAGLVRAVESVAAKLREHAFTPDQQSGAPADQEPAVSILRAVRAHRHRVPPECDAITRARQEDELRRPASPH